jgi:predicted benzoate:H+ symporter BenE
VMVCLQALARGKSVVVSGWKNKLMTASVSLLPKSVIARLAGLALGHFRMKAAKP